MLLFTVVVHTVPQLILPPDEVTVPLPTVETVRVLATVVTVIFAEQLAVVPPFNPLHVQVQGPEPVTDDAVPVEQSPVVGMVETVVLLDEPQVPVIGVGVLTVPPGQMFDGHGVPRYSQIYLVNPLVTNPLLLTFPAGEYPGLYCV